MKNILVFSIFLFSVFLLSCQKPQQNIDIEVISTSDLMVRDQLDGEICNSFSLRSDQIALYFTVAQEVNEHEFNQNAVILPCWYEGQIVINNQTINWKIYAGGAGYLYEGSNINKRYLCDEMCCSQLTNIC